MEQPYTCLCGNVKVNVDEADIGFTHDEELLVLTTLTSASSTAADLLASSIPKSKSGPSPSPTLSTVRKLFAQGYLLARYSEIPALVENKPLSFRPTTATTSSELQRRKWESIQCAVCALPVAIIGGVVREESSPDRPLRQPVLLHPQAKHGSAVVRLPQEADFSTVFHVLIPSSATAHQPQSSTTSSSSSSSSASSQLLLANPSAEDATGDDNFSDKGMLYPELSETVGDEEEGVDQSPETLADVESDQAKVAAEEWLDDEEDDDDDAEDDKEDAADETAEGKRVKSSGLIGRERGDIRREEQRWRRGVKQQYQLVLSEEKKAVEQRIADFIAIQHSAYADFSTRARSDALRLYSTILLASSEQRRRRQPQQPHLLASSSSSSAAAATASTISAAAAAAVSATPASSSSSSSSLTVLQSMNQPILQTTEGYISTPHPLSDDTLAMSEGLTPTSRVRRRTRERSLSGGGGGGGPSVSATGTTITMTSSSSSSSGGGSSGSGGSAPMMMASPTGMLTRARRSSSSASSAGPSSVRASGKKKSHEGVFELEEGDLATESATQSRRSSATEPTATPSSRTKSRPLQSATQEDDTTADEHVHVRGRETTKDEDESPILDPELSSSISPLMSPRGTRRRSSPRKPTPSDKGKREEEGGDTTTTGGLTGDEAQDTLRQRRVSRNRGGSKTDEENEDKNDDDDDDQSSEEDESSEADEDETPEGSTAGLSRPPPTTTGFLMPSAASRALTRARGSGTSGAERLLSTSVPISIPRPIVFGPTDLTTTTTTTTTTTSIAVTGEADRSAAAAAYMTSSLAAASAAKKSPSKQQVVTPKKIPSSDVTANGEEVKLQPTALAGQPPEKDQIKAEEDEEEEDDDFASTKAVLQPSKPATVSKQEAISIGLRAVPGTRYALARKQADEEEALLSRTYYAGRSLSGYEDTASASSDRGIPIVVGSFRRVINFTPATTTSTTTSSTSSTPSTAISASASGSSSSSSVIGGFASAPMAITAPSTRTDASSSSAAVSLLSRSLQSTTRRRSGAQY